MDENEVNTSGADRRYTLVTVLQANGRRWLANSLLGLSVLAAWAGATLEWGAGVGLLALAVASFATAFLLGQE
jgi:hypothetical protein